MAFLQKLTTVVSIWLLYTQKRMSWTQSNPPFQNVLFPPTLPLLPGPFWSIIVVADRISSVDEIEQFICVQTNDWC